MPNETDRAINACDSPAQAIEKADIAVGRVLATHRNHPVVRWCCGVGEVGDQGPLYIIGASIVATGILRKSPHCLLAGISMLAAVGVADVTKRSIKKLVKRSRPNHLLDEGNYEFEVGGSPKKIEQSFPSGHVAGTVAAAGILSRFYPTTAGYTNMATGIITLSRIVKGRHWPLDVAAGFVVGRAASGVVLYLLFNVFRSWMAKPVRRKIDHLR